MDNLLEWQEGKVVKAPKMHSETIIKIINRMKFMITFIDMTVSVYNIPLLRCKNPNI